MNATLAHMQEYCMYFFWEKFILLFIRSWIEVLLVKCLTASYNFTENIYFVWKKI